ncbi:hypothetical protein [Schinkia azotoformans]|uniref:hypothetical protein n=1 Tax=Schinkia azotoformans TaxID=1454 RepID=UPI002DBF3502|nr:hypothetical protein [Schinkia azotoformans]MEC1788612.1 hypothetical protein [Schinkia azotoformans]MED4419931.1 hypothetical protein [Schinkia azotoformans]
MKRGKKVHKRHNNCSNSRHSKTLADSNSQNSRQNTAKDIFFESFARSFGESFGTSLGKWLAGLLIVIIPSVIFSVKNGFSSLITNLKPALESIELLISSFLYLNYTFIKEGENNDYSSKPSFL